MRNLYNYTYTFWKYVRCAGCKFPQVSVESLLLKGIMFSNTLDLKTIRMYLSMGYEVIFKYKYGFISLIELPEKQSVLHFFTTYYCFEEILPDLQICSKQDIFNYCYWTKNSNNTKYPYNRDIVLVSLTSEIFN